MPRARSPSSRAFEAALLAAGVEPERVERFMVTFRATFGGCRIYIPQLPAAERERIVVKRFDRYRG